MYYAIYSMLILKLNFNLHIIHLQLIDFICLSSWMLLLNMYTSLHLSICLQVYKISKFMCKMSQLILFLAPFVNVSYIILVLFKKKITWNYVCFFRFVYSFFFSRELTFLIYIFFSFLYSFYDKNKK